MIRLFLALLVLPSVLQAQVAMRDVSIRDLVVGAGATAPHDWSGSFVAWWALDDAQDVTEWVNSAGTTCGTTVDECNFDTETGTITRNTTIEIEGTAAQTFDTTDKLLCPNTSGNCDDLAFSGDVTFGGWVYVDSDINTYIFRGLVSSAGGYSAWRANSTDDIRCDIADGSDTEVASGTNGNLPIDTWVAWACIADGYDVFEFSSALATPYNDIGDQEAMAAQPFGGFTLGYSTNADMVYDMTFVANKALTSAELAHVFACNPDGSDCTCNGATYVSGRFDTDCDASGDPWECCTGNGTGCLDADWLTGDCNGAAP